MLSDCEVAALVIVQQFGHLPNRVGAMCVTLQYIHWSEQLLLVPRCLLLLLHLLLQLQLVNFDGERFVRNSLSFLSIIYQS
jgi:hypothetical protein